MPSQPNGRLSINITRLKGSLCGKTSLPLIEGNLIIFPAERVVLIILPMHAGQSRAAIDILFLVPARLALNSRRFGIRRLLAPWFLRLLDQHNIYAEMSSRDDHAISARFGLLRSPKH